MAAVGVRDMNPQEVFARAEELLAYWLREEGGSRLEVEIQGIGFVQDRLMWMTVDGEARSVQPESSETGFAVNDLRRAQVVPGLGAWTWCRLWMVAGEWVLHQECDWMREPVFDPPGGGRPDPRTCANELERHPRDAENIPGWMAEGVAANERRKAANARRREARRAKKERERQAAQAQAASS
ncbi:hypothetical protein [Actinomyces wuliandei]|uniref:hypothetical protein n=1 Tax=Actinomyces wuliandei TaxID=2057743 RepID=UPI001FA9DE1E|nr:hypothetical protein [Actinomyces wuliandei]